MKKAVCAKCNKYTYVDSHHILPQSVFGKNKETIDLCPNCHREYHDKLGSKNLKNESMEFHLYFFYRWQNGLLAFLILIGIVALYLYVSPKQIPHEALSQSQNINCVCFYQN